MVNPTPNPSEPGHLSWQSSQSGYNDSQDKACNGHVSVQISQLPTRNKKVKDFRPWIHRTIPLIVLWALVLALIGALEHGMRQLPQTTVDTSYEDAAISYVSSSKRENVLRGVDVDLEKRQAVDPTGSSNDTETPTSAVLMGGSPVVTSSYAPTAPGAPAPSQYNQASATTFSISVGAPAPSIYNQASGTAYTVITVPAVSQSGSISPAVITLPPGVQDSPLPLTLTNEGNNYFLGVYFPVLVAVLLRLLFGYLNRCTRLVDPFFMLNRAEGGTAYDLFRADFLGTEALLAPFYALRAKRWLLFWTSIVYAVAQLLTPFASELLSIQESNYTVQNSDGATLSLGQALWINPVVGRLIQGLLAFLAVMLISLWFTLRTHRSGISTNPASVATIASLLDHPTTSADFLAVDQGSSKKEIAKRLSSRRYKLDYYVATDGSQRYGVIPVDVVFEGRTPQLASIAQYVSTEPPSMTGNPAQPQNISAINASQTAPSKGKHVKPLLILTVSAIVLLGLIMAYANNHIANSFEFFMDSQSFGPKFMLSVLALLVKAPLMTVCTKAIASVPFTRLASKPRSADLDLFEHIPLTPQGAIWYSLKRREWFTACLAICGGVLIELMLILVPGVPFRQEQFYMAALVSWYGCIACCLLFIFISFVGWVRFFLRIGEYQLPKNPGRVGAVGLYVAGSRMTYDLAGSAAAAESSVEAMGSGADFKLTWHANVNNWKARYDFKPRNGRWLVDFASVGNVEDGMGARPC